jgi:hypothetical protein
LNANYELVACTLVRHVGFWKFANAAFTTNMGRNAAETYLPLSADIVEKVGFP